MINSLLLNGYSQLQFNYAKADIPAVPPFCDPTSPVQWCRLYFTLLRRDMGPGFFGVWAWCRCGVIKLYVLNLNVQAK